MKTPRSYKTQQLDISLGSIQDAATREALTSIVRFVNDMTQKVRTNKEVKASKISNADETASIDEAGNLAAKSLNLNDGGEFKTMRLDGTLGPSATRDIPFKDGTRILGAIGWTQVNATSEWNPMSRATSTGQVFLSTSVNVLTNSLRVVNESAVNTNNYRVLIFYADR